jgi:hypothetical protein
MAEKQERQVRSVKLCGPVEDAWEKLGNNSNFNLYVNLAMAEKLGVPSEEVLRLARRKRDRK